MGNLCKDTVLNAVRIAEEELKQDILAIRKVW